MSRTFPSLSARPGARRGVSVSSGLDPPMLFVAALRERDVLEGELLVVLARRVAGTGELPHGRVTECRVVPLRLAVLGLMLDAEMTAARLVAVERVDAHQLGELHEIGDAAGQLERLV